MTRWTLLRLLSKSCSLPQRQRRSSATFLIMPYWRNTKIEEKGGGRERYHISDQSTPLLGSVDGTHNHDEADTMVPLHVIDAIDVSTLRDIYVWSPDTDVLILLMDIVARG